MRIKGGARNTYLRVFISHHPLGGGNVGPALQHVGGHSKRDWRRCGSQRRRGYVEAGCRLAYKHSDGVLILRTRLLHQRDLRDRRVEHRGLLRNFQPAGDSTFVAIV